MKSDISMDLVVEIINESKLITQKFEELTHTPVKLDIKINFKYNSLVRIIKLFHNKKKYFESINSYTTSYLKPSSFNSQRAEILVNILHKILPFIPITKHKEMYDILNIEYSKKIFFEAIVTPHYIFVPVLSHSMSEITGKQNEYRILYIEDKIYHSYLISAYTFKHTNTLNTLINYHKYFLEELPEFIFLMIRNYMIQRKKTDFLPTVELSKIKSHLIGTNTRYDALYREELKNDIERRSLLMDKKEFFSNIWR